MCHNNSAMLAIDPFKKNRRCSETMGVNDSISENQGTDGHISLIGKATKAF